jgi:hypothetical protein
VGGDGVCILIVRLLQLEVLAASRKVCVCVLLVRRKNCEVANCSCTVATELEEPRAGRDFFYEINLGLKNKISSFPLHCAL